MSLANVNEDEKKNCESLIKLILESAKKFPFIETCYLLLITTLVITKGVGCCWRFRDYSLLQPVLYL